MYTNIVPIIKSVLIIEFNIAVGVLFIRGGLLLFSFLYLVVCGTCVCWMMSELVSRAVTERENILCIASLNASILQ